MRCPKCHYISFEGGDRCRNCGYEFSLSAVPEPSPDLELNDRDQDPVAPIDLFLSEADARREAVPGSENVTPVEFGRDSSRPTSFDLPLFTGGDPDAPLIKPSAAPRAPLAVRRPTPDAGRLRARYPVAEAAEAPRLDLGIVTAAGPEPDVRTRAEPPLARRRSPASPALGAPAPPGRRLLAGLIDVALIGGINAGVLYFTLKLCALPLTAEGLLTLPAVPMIGFLLLLDGGYAVAFTAAIGQTIGKMAMRLRVVHVREDQGDNGPSNFSFAVLRTAAYLASLLPVGLGFLPALFGRDRRALHDRLADTRVVAL
jgi:uncharacterized RDD family membrane protein YckC